MKSSIAIGRPAPPFLYKHEECSARDGCMTTESQD
ncbi:MAG: hypothetical protein QOI59_5874 [Gammaproteobacteria bacterium]|jgi:hypothetical protein|nr:hypothetical protein [Gammaproteobacteria bacterium]